MSQNLNKQKNVYIMKFSFSEIVSATSLCMYKQFLLPLLPFYAKVFYLATWK